MNDHTERKEPTSQGETIELRDEAGNVVATADIALGHPDNPYRGQLLSAEDERRLDEKGQEVVKGVPWGEAQTGLWLAVAVGSGPLSAHVPPIGGTSFSISQRITRGADMRLFVGTFRDTKPRWSTATTGACIELPHDLAQDEIKRKYLTEWLAHTCVEALIMAGVGFDMHHETLGIEYQKVAVQAAWAAEDAIGSTGL